MHVHIPGESPTTYNGLDTTFILHPTISINAPSPRHREASFWTPVTQLQRICLLPADQAYYRRFRAEIRRAFIAAIFDCENWGSLGWVQWNNAGSGSEGRRLALFPAPSPLVLFHSSQSSQLKHPRWRQRMWSGRIYPMRAINVCSAGKMRCIATHSHEHILHFANTFASGLVRSDAHAIGLPQGSPPGRYAGEYKGIEWGFAPGQAKIQDHGRQPRGCHGNIFYWEISDQRTLSHTNYPSPGEIVNFARCILQSPGGRLGCQPLTRESEPVLLPEIYWGGTPGRNEDWTR